MKFYPPAIVFGFTILMLAIWGGFGISYFLGEGHWAQFPLNLTAMFFGAVGVCMFLGGIKMEGPKE